MLQGRRQEFGVVDHTAAVRVDALHELLQVPPAHLQPGLLQPPAELRQRQQPVAVRVQRRVDVAQAPNLLGTQLPRDHVEHRLLELVLRPEGPEPVHEALLQGHAGSLGRFLRDPGVLQGLLGRQALLRAGLHQHADEVLGVVGDVPPVPVAEVETALLHLGEHLAVALPAEGRVAAQEHVHDHARAPKVAPLGVPAGEHLWGHIEGRPGPGGHELARLEVVGEAEVYDL
mmetsp:Transcript_27484/g.73297  ORF Transcript_27484/g.73297 Transcript_27484/m.73297 type:complete len:230 (+) Transcript_27484:653-1342(+)